MYATVWVQIACSSYWRNKQSALDVSYISTAHNMNVIFTCPCAAEAADDSLHNVTDATTV